MDGTTLGKWRCKMAGERHTWRESLQQPATWLDTCNRLIGQQEMLKERLSGIRSLVLSGSGSSQFAGECVRGVLERELGIRVSAMDGGALLTHGKAALPADKPALVVSLGRSGNSPESTGVVSLLLESQPEVRHLAVTCNPEGGLAQARVPAVLLDPRTNDRSLVMTSSFTNLVLAARFLGLVDEPERYRSICCMLSGICRDLLARHIQRLERAAQSRFDRVVYLASDPDRGAVHEASLKMLEMTAGRVATMAETYLALRHGPMSFIDERTLVVCFLSCDPYRREYEFDLIQELNRKNLGLMKLLIGEEPFDLPGLDQAGDDHAALLHVVVGQLLAYFRCVAEGLNPDSPSENGAISRVVEEFPIYRRPTESTR